MGMELWRDTFYFLGSGKYVCSLAQVATFILAQQTGLAPWQKQGTDITQTVRTSPAVGQK